MIGPACGVPGGPPAPEDACRRELEVATARRVELEALERAIGVAKLSLFRLIGAVFATGRLEHEFASDAIATVQSAVDALYLAADRVRLTLASELLKEPPAGDDSTTLEWLEEANGTACALSGIAAIATAPRETPEGWGEIRAGVREVADRLGDALRLARTLEAAR